MNCFLGFVVFFYFGLNTAYSADSSAKPYLVLTPYIENNQTELARNLSTVDSKLFLNVTSHSGFINVDPVHNSNLFFWYFPVANKPLNATPWIVWLQGGPGATSLLGLFEEIGPFEYSDGKLKLRQWSWGKHYSLLFIDNPVGAGFSFTDSDDGYVTNMDQCANHLYGFLQQFLEIFPELRSADLYLAGESYAGHFVPALAHKILHPPANNNMLKSKLKITNINLKGLMMGNPMIDLQDETELLNVYYQWGLLDRQNMLALKPLQEKYNDAVCRNDSSVAFKLRNEFLDRLDRVTAVSESFNILEDKVFFKEFLLRDDVKKALHASGIPKAEFSISDYTVHFKLISDFLAPAGAKVQELLDHYKVLIYCGQFNLVAPCVLNAEARRAKWRWNNRSQFLDAPRHPWMYNDSLAGYVKSGGHLTEVLILNCGHLALMEKPAEVSELIDYFIRGLDLPLPINFNEKDFVNAPYIAPSEPGDKPTQVTTNNVMIASAVLNVIFVLVIIVGVVYWIRWKRRVESYFRWKRRVESYFYYMLDNNSITDDAVCGSQ